MYKHKGGAEETLQSQPSSKEHSKEAKTMWHGVSQTGDYKRILSTTLLFSTVVFPSSSSRRHRNAPCAKGKNYF